MVANLISTVNDYKYLNKVNNYCCYYYKVSARNTSIFPEVGRRQAHFVFTIWLVQLNALSDGTEVARIAKYSWPLG